MTEAQERSLTGEPMSIIAAVQETITQQGTTITLSPVMLTLAGGLISVAVAWGVIKTMIRQVTDELGRVRSDLKALAQTQQTMMVETLERVARIEGKLNV